MKRKTKKIRCFPTYLCELSLGKDFLNKSQKPQTMKEKIGKSDCIKKQVIKQADKTSGHQTTSEKSKHTLERHLEKISIENIYYKSIKQRVIIQCNNINIIMNKDRTWQL